ncbi:MAG: type II toxin-antitoxin system VapC family toxin [Wenzhouxiangella sp.]|nr:type II toxin-antitoxin system VapC family toxin [Wenzhouxiangella sp.]
MHDVNILVHAHREDSPHHALCRGEIDNMLATPAAFGLSPLILSGLVRVVTHPRVFDPPSPSSLAMQFCDFLIAQPQATVVRPGRRHWQIFSELVEQGNCRGNLVPDAYLAAIATEHGATFVTLDRDFARFEALEWRLPA